MSVSRRSSYARSNISDPILRDEVCESFVHSNIKYHSPHFLQVTRELMVTGIPELLEFYIVEAIINQDKKNVKIIGPLLSNSGISITVTFLVRKMKVLKQCNLEIGENMICAKYKWLTRETVTEKCVKIL